MKNKSTDTFFIIMPIIMVVVFLLSFGLGRYSIDPITLLKVLFSKIFPIEQTWSDQIETIIFQIRLPRIILALFIGAALSVAGLVYQGLFQNPMVSPDVLGTSSGAGFGTAIAILLELSYFQITMFGFLFGIIAVLLVLVIAKKVPSQPILTLVLGGIMVSSLFSSLISFVKLIADTENTLPAITYFLMGSLSSVRTSDILLGVIIISLSIIPIFLMRWQLNVMTQGEEEAISLGINTKMIRIVSIICATLMTAITVAIAGMIGWIGLVIPHLVRMLVGSDYRKTITASILMGSSFLLLVDTLSRVVYTMEIPLGILTSFIGAPFFLFLIKKEGRR